MGNNKTMLGILIVLISIIIGGYMLYGEAIKEAYQQKDNPIEEEIVEEEEAVEEEEEEVKITATYDTKIVYTSEVSNPEIYKADCEQRGWVFNECGSPCGPDDDFCITVCAYTCEKPEAKSEKYTDIRLGITFEAPGDMKSDEKDGSLRVYKWGPSQTEGTEFYDGVVISFMKAENPENLALEEFANMELANELDFEAELLKPLAEVTHGGITGYEFMTFGLGEWTSFYFNNSAGEIIRTTYFSEDPSNQGFEEMLGKILDSLKYIQ